MTADTKQQIGKWLAFFLNRIELQRCLKKCSRQALMLISAIFSYDPYGQVTSSFCTSHEVIFLLGKKHTIFFQMWIATLHSIWDHLNYDLYVTIKKTNNSQRAGVTHLKMLISFAICISLSCGPLLFVGFSCTILSFPYEYRHTYV